MSKKFYNFGEAKGFTKKVFYETVLDLAEGEFVSDNAVDLVKKACSYELENIANRPAKAPSGERRDPLQSKYAVEIREAILPFVNDTPMTVAELVTAATGAGKVSSMGKPFSVPWVARVLAAEEGISQVVKVVETTNAKGLKTQVEAKAYRR